MDDVKALILSKAKQWDNQAKAWDSQARRINKAKCFEGDRKMRIGMAAVSRLHADQLRNMAESIGSGDKVLPEAKAVVPIQDGDAEQEGSQSKDNLSATNDD